MKSLYILFLLLFVCSFPAYTKDKMDYKFNTLSPLGRLSVDGIKKIVQDNDGFIWVLTCDDLLRFDGYNFQTYSPKIQIPNDDAPIIYNEILFSKKHNCLFLATSRGIFVYNKLHHNFEFLLPGLTERLFENVTTGVLYLIGSHLRIYNPNTHEIRNIQTKMVQCASCTNGQVFVTERNALFCLENDLKLSLLHTFQDGSPFVALQCVGKELWMLSETKGVFCWNIEKQCITHKIDSFLSEFSNNISAKCMYVDQFSSKIWVGTMQGLFLLDIQKHSYQKFVRNYSDKSSLINNSIWTLFKDKQEGLWIGTYAGGISYLRAESNRGFQNYPLEMFKITPRPISAFAQGEGGIWLGTEGGGVCMFEGNKNITKILKNRKNQNSLKHDNVKTLLNDSNGNLWIGMYKGGVDCYNLHTGKFQNYNAMNIDKRLISDEVYKFVAEADSGMWVIYQSSQTALTYFAFNKEHSEHYFFDKSNLYKENRVTGICRDSMGYLYFSTYKNLFRFDIRKKQIEAIQIPKNIISCIRFLYFENKDRVLWLGTQGQGLLRYQVDMEEFKLFDFYPQFGNLTITSIISDLSGNLWLGSNQGLYRFNKQTESLSKYDEGNMAFYPNATFRGTDGRLYFGGLEGFTLITPDSIQTNIFKPKVLIADIRVNLNSIYDASVDENLRKRLVNEKKINLSHWQNRIEIELAADNYLLPSKNRYKYRLCGFEDKWTEVDASRRYVSYPKLPAGHYRFEAIASNNDGMWGETFKMDIVVRPAPWLSWWAYSCYVLLLSLIIYSIYRNRMKKLQLENEIYKTELHEQEQEKVHQAKLQFFTNITHDFKTPLTMILGMLDSMEEDKIGIPSFYMDALKKNSHRLLKLVNEVVDFQMVENEVMKPDIRLNNLNSLLHSCVSEIWGYAFKKGVSVRISYDMILSETLFFDYQIVEKIVMNLLDNSLKYTASDGKIQLLVYANISTFVSEFSYSHTEGTLDNRKDYWGFVVKDTGSGISSESISEVFTRFFRINDSKEEPHLGSGIGLALVKSLVLIHQGVITIYSERGKGTEFLVCFPYMTEKEVEKEETKIPENNNRQVIEESPSQEQEATAISTSYNFDTEPGTTKILLVEDNEELRELIKNRLSKKYTIVEATDGEQALQLLESTSIDLVLSDWMMPKMDGIVLCTQMKKNSLWAHIPFVLMTVRNQKDDRFEGYAAGAEAYIEKPVDFKLLDNQINNLLSLREHFRKHYSENYFIEPSQKLHTNEQNELMNQLTEILKNEITSPELSVDSIAKKMLISRRKLLTVVQECTGKSVVEFIRSYKMHHALHLLLEQGVSIKELPQMVGIESASYFTKSFKEEFGTTPSAMLKKNKN